MACSTQACDERRVADVAVDKDITRVGGDVAEIRGISRVGERVEIDESCNRGSSAEQALTHEIVADETATASDEEIHDVQAAFFQ